MRVFSLFDKFRTISWAASSSFCLSCSCFSRPDCSSIGSCVETFWGRKLLCVDSSFCSWSVSLELHGELSAENSERGMLFWCQLKVNCHCVGGTVIFIVFSRVFVLFIHIFLCLKKEYVWWFFIDHTHETHVATEVFPKLEVMFLETMKGVPMYPFDQISM